MRTHDPHEAAGSPPIAITYQCHKSVTFPISLAVKLLLETRLALS